MTVEAVLANVHFSIKDLSLLICPHQFFGLLVPKLLLVLHEKLVLFVVEFIGEVMSQ
jgi:hypothetical protein